MGEELSQSLRLGIVCFVGKKKNKGLIFWYSHIFVYHFYIDVPFVIYLGTLRLDHCPF